MSVLVLWNEVLVNLNLAWIINKLASLFKLDQYVRFFFLTISLPDFSTFWEHYKIEIMYYYYVTVTDSNHIYILTVVIRDWYVHAK